MPGTAAHTYLKNKIRKLIKQLGGYVLSLPAGSATGKGRTDLVACVQGRFIGMEVKTGNAKATPLQLDNMAEIRASGGLALIARDVEQTRWAINRYLKTETWKGIIMAKTSEVDQFDAIFEDDDEEDEEAPRKKVTKKAPPAAAPIAKAKRPRPPVEEDDDEEEAPPAPAKKTNFKLANAKDNPGLVAPESAKDKLVRLEDDIAAQHSTLAEILDLCGQIRDELRQLRELATEEDDEPAPPPVSKNGLSSRKPAAKAPARPPVDDDDEDDEEDDDEDDEELMDDLFEDEPAPKKKATPPARGRRPR